MSDKLNDFINSEIEESILRYPIVFKDFLELDEEVYKKLSKAGNLFSFFVGALIAGLGYYFLAMFGIGTFSGILLALGIASPVSVPILIVTIIGGGSVAVILKKISDKNKKKFFTILPKYINTPLDFLAQGIAEYLYVRCEDKNKMNEFLTDKMGYNEQFLKSYKFKDVKIDKFQDSLEKLFKKNKVDFNKFLEKVDFFGC